MTDINKTDQAAQDAQWKTLAEHNVQVGDVVQYHKMGEPRTISRVSGGRYYASNIHDFNLEATLATDGLFRVISRANLTPTPQPDLSNPNRTPWRDMTPAEKVDAIYEGLKGAKPDLTGKDRIRDVLECLGAIPPAPKRETVTLYTSAPNAPWGWTAEQGASPHRTHTITFDTLDSQPITGRYVNETGDVVIVEALK